MLCLSWMDKSGEGGLLCCRWYDDIAVPRETGFLFQ